MNCIGPIAPADDGPWLRPWPLSTWPTAASRVQSQPRAGAGGGVVRGEVLGRGPGRGGPGGQQGRPGRRQPARRRPGRAQPAGPGVQPVQLRLGRGQLPVRLPRLGLDRVQRPGGARVPAVRRALRAGQRRGGAGSGQLGGTVRRQQRAEHPVGGGRPPERIVHRTGVHHAGGQRRGAAAGVERADLPGLAQPGRVRRAERAVAGPPGPGAGVEGCAQGRDGVTDRLGAALRPGGRSVHPGRGGGRVGPGGAHRIAGPRGGGGCGQRRRDQRGGEHAGGSAGTRHRQDVGGPRLRPDPPPG